MPISHYPHGFNHGVSIQGLPVLNTYGGNVYWVDSGSGVDSTGNDGSFNKPWATLDYAIGNTTASNGDIVMLKPGHAENVADATTFQVDVAGVAVVGLGSGTLRPTFTFTGTAGSVEMDSANCLIQNVRFLASVSAVVVGVNVDANDCALIGCEFDWDATGDDFLIFVDCTDVARTRIEGCRFIAEIAAGANHAIELDNSDYIQIVGNYFFGDFANAAIYGDTTGDTGDGSSVSHGVIIKQNDIYTADTAIGTAIDLNSADTGVIAYNNLSGPTGGGVAALLDPGSCMSIENYGVDAINEHAIVTPLTAAT